MSVSLSISGEFGNLPPIVVIDLYHPEHLHVDVGSTGESGAALSTDGKVVAAAIKYLSLSLLARLCGLKPWVKCSIEMEDSNAKSFFVTSKKLTHS